MFDRTRPILVLLLSGLLPAAAAASEPVFQTAFLTPDVTLARTISSVALSDSTLLIGYTDADDSGNDRGAVYVVDRQPDGTWSQTGKLLPVTPKGIEFGSSVAIEGDFAAVGDGTSFSGLGGIWIFQRTAGLWSQTQVVNPPFVFGGGHASHVAMDGEDLVIGSPLYFDNGKTVGALYFYRRSGSTYVHGQGPLLPSDKDTGGAWARAVAIDGDVAVTGYYLPGQVYVLERSGPGQPWAETLKLASPAPQSAYGRAVAVEGDWIAIGAPEDDEKANNAGAVWIHHRQGPGQWTLHSKVFAADAELGDFFGSSIALEAGRLLVGAELEDGAHTDAGAAYLFERDAGGAWVQRAKLGHPAPATFDSLGKFVALTAEGQIAAACPGDDDVASGLGTVLLFDGEMLSSPVDALSLSQGGLQPLDVQAGAAAAGQTYFVVGSLSGTSPGLPIPNGFTLPLNPDAYTVFTLTMPNSSLLSNSLGTLGAGGGAEATFALPMNTTPAVAGLTLHHAAVVLDTSSGWTVLQVSNPRAVLLVP